jgi:hypothetical protein
MNVRHATVVADSPVGGWTPVRVTWPTERIIHEGWWRHDDIGVLTVVTDPPTNAPVVAINRSGAA